jgi:cytochrome c-type biogenesis protein CcmH/NrfF
MDIATGTVRDPARRRLLRAVLVLGVAPAVNAVRLPGQEPLAGGGARGALRDPTIAGRSRSPTVAGDSDDEIKRIEQQLKCTCGCNLDIFTCRTTDFTCTYSPQLHQEVVALRDGGRTAQEIIDAFVAKYGEKALMAPKPVGFNLWGYLLPGAAIVTGAGLLAVVIARRERRRSAELAASAGAAGAARGVPIEATPGELESLRRALSEMED